MNAWSQVELSAIGGADELEIAPLRSDGRLSRSTTIWVVRVGDELYVRSWRGRNGAWFRQALASHQGRVRAGGVERAVTFREPDGAHRRVIDDAYRTKYARYAAQYVEPMVGIPAASATLQLIPQ